MPFLDGLLPESLDARREKARALDVGDDLMSLLSVMGWDCPGAVQITPPGQLEAMRARAGGLQPVSDREIGQRIARLRDHRAEWTLPDEHWSLAGQQGAGAGRALEERVDPHPAQRGRAPGSAV